VLGGASVDSLDVDSTDFISLWGSNASNTEAAVEALMPLDGTLSNLYVRLSGAPSTGDSYTFTVRKNGADEAALTCQVSGNTAVDCNDTTGTVAFVAGDRITIESTPASDPDPQTMRWTARYTP
jgi:hypothetical protein